MLLIKGSFQICLIICINFKTMEEKHFLYRSYCELAIISDSVNPNDITEELKIIPSRFFHKGQQRYPLHNSLRNKFKFCFYNFCRLFIKLKTC